jgi:hypothetical protein
LNIRKKKKKRKQNRKKKWGGQFRFSATSIYYEKKKKKNQQTHYLAYTIQEDQVFINPYQHATFLSLYVPQSCNLQKKKNVTTK